jgi:hypothetical protein
MAAAAVDLFSLQHELIGKHRSAEKEEKIPILSSVSLAIPSNEEVKQKTEHEKPRSISELMELCDDTLIKTTEHRDIPASQPFKISDVGTYFSITRFKGVAGFDYLGGIVHLFGHTSQDMLSSRNQMLQRIVNELTKHKQKQTAALIPYRSQNSPDRWKTGLFMIKRVVQQSDDHYILVMGKVEDFVDGTNWSSYTIFNGDKKYKCGVGEVTCTQWLIEEVKDKELERTTHQQSRNDIRRLEQNIRLLYDLAKGIAFAPSGPLSHEAGVAFSTPNKKRKVSELEKTTETKIPGESFLSRFNVGDRLIVPGETPIKGIVCDKFKYGLMVVTSEGGMRAMREVELISAGAYTEEEEEKKEQADPRSCDPHDDSEDSLDALLE